MEKLRSNKPLSCNNSKHLYVYLAKLRNNYDPQKSFFPDENSDSRDEGGIQLISQPLNGRFSWI